MGQCIAQPSISTESSCSSSLHQSRSACSAAWRAWQWCTNVTSATTYSHHATLAMQHNAALAARLLARISHRLSPPSRLSHPARSHPNPCAPPHLDRMHVLLAANLALQAKHNLLRGLGLQSFAVQEHGGERQSRATHRHLSAHHTRLSRNSAARPRAAHISVTPMHKPALIIQPHDAPRCVTLPCVCNPPSCGRQAWSDHRILTASGRNAACLRIEPGTRVIHAWSPKQIPGVQAHPTSSALQPQSPPNQCIHRAK